MGLALFAFTLPKKKKEKAAHAHDTTIHVSRSALAERITQYIYRAFYTLYAQLY